MKNQAARGCLYTVIAIILIILVIWIWGKLDPGTDLNPKTTFTPAEDAWTTCTMFIERQLGLSIMDAQEYNPSGVTVPADNEFIVNVYYAKNNATYQCDILKQSDGNWNLLALRH
jgi:hypothetical protein